MTLPAITANTMNELDFRAGGIPGIMNGGRVCVQTPAASLAVHIFL